MNKSRIFLYLATSFIVGVFLKSFHPAGLFFLPAGLLTLGIIILTVFYKNKKAALAAFILLFFSLGFWRTENRLEELKNLTWDGKTYSGRAIVAKEPEQKDGYQKIIFQAENPKINFLANMGMDENIRCGDAVAVVCVLKIPDNRAADFDYRMYLAKDGIYYLCQQPKIIATGKHFGNWIYQALIGAKNNLSGQINALIPYPYSTLGNGLIFGGSSELPEKLKDNFSRTGLTHIVAVSGYNVTIVAQYLILFGIIIGLWRQQAFWFALTGIFIFVAMTGFPASAVRAGVMGGVLLWAMKNGRLGNSWNAIILAAAVMLFLNPLLLRYDVGFQLSFLATMGIVIFSPLGEKYLLGKHSAWGLAEMTFLTMSAQIFVLPILLYNFGVLSLISLLANILVLPIIPFSMLLVFLTAILGWLAPLLAPGMAWLTYSLLKYEIDVITILGNWKWSSLKIENFGVGGLIGYYAMLILGIYFFRYREFQKRNVVQ
jgi:competence protein ComEC